MDGTVIIYIIGFVIVSIAGFQIAGYFQKIKFPLITGLIVTGIVAGSSVLNFIPKESLNRLQFLNELSLAVIAFSAGSELYLKELRSRLNSIKWMTIGQLGVTFILSTFVIYFFADYVPFMKDGSTRVKLAIAILFATIFVARSPSSAIAVINELRARGPFTKTAIGVTVVKDVLVIILFAISFSLAKAFVNDEEVGFMFILFLVMELLVSFGLGLLLGVVLNLALSLNLNKHLKALLIVVLGYSIYLLAHFIKIHSDSLINHEVVLEPLLICIIASFYVINYTKNRIEFTELLEEISPIIYIIFFTLTGASLSIQVLMSVFWVAIAFFLLRIIAMIFGGVFGVLAAKDDKKYTFLSWMPYVTQAGVALGLTTLISREFPVWGDQFEAIVIAIIVINQLVGPPLFKLSINLLGESHVRKDSPEFDGVRDVFIFGLDSQSVALALTLKKRGWVPKIIALDLEFDNVNQEIEIVSIPEISLEALKEINVKIVDAVVCLLTDKENYELASLFYEKIGVKDIIARIHNRAEFSKFNDLGVRIIEPSMAIVSLLDHFVRSPNAASLLLGLDEKQDAVDFEVRNRDIHGLTLRDLRFPTDVIVLSVSRKGQALISHGYTRLRKGDIVTLVGSTESLEVVRLKLGA